MGNYEFEKITRHELQDKNETLELKCKKVKEKYKEAKTYMEKFNHKEAEYCHLMDQIESSRTELHEAREHITDHQMKIHGLSDKIEHLECQLEQSRSELKFMI